MSRRLTSLLTVAVALVVFADSPGIRAQNPAPAPQGQPGRGGQQPATAPGQPGGGRGAGRGQARDAAGTPTSAVGTGAISGAVTMDATGAPVRRARVTLSGAELRGGRSAITDDTGRFSFTSLPAGRFTLTASKAGYVDITYGAKRPGRPGTPIQLADGEKLDKANLTLPRGSVITGIVIDENGEPSPGTQVRAMRYVIRTGEKTLVQAGQDQTDDRGIYRIYQLQPGDYMLSAVPRNTNLGDLRQTILAEVESLMQQAQAQSTGAGFAPRGGGGGGGGGGRGGGRAGLDPGMLGRGGGAAQQLIDRANMLQQQLSQTEQEQTVAYAPVYYPGTTAPSSASTVTIGVGEERAGVDFQLQLVRTARLDGQVMSADGTVPQGVQIALSPSDRAGMPSIPGVSVTMTRVGNDGRFSFSNVTPGQYTLQARANIRQATPTDPNAPAAAQGPGGRGGRGQDPFGRGPGGPGQIAQVLWASVDVSVSGQNMPDLMLNLQPGLTMSGRVEFQGTAQPPTDLTRVRVNLSTRGSQVFEIGGVPPATVDAAGRFTIPGIAPGRYVLSANAAVGGGPNGRGGGPGAAPAAAGAQAGATGGTWVLKSAALGGRDTLDFPIDVGPNQELSNALLTFTDKTQELSGTIQDALGRPTSDFTIIVFPNEQQYWLPQSRRILSSRPGTDGKFTFRNLPPGSYRLTAVTDVEPGEWYDPSFLTQLLQVSIPITIADGEKKTQDIRLAR